MINEIKNARTTFGAFDATSYQKDKWLRYLLEEVGRLHEENIALLCSGAVDANNNVSLKSDIKVLQKALEQQKHRMQYGCENGSEEETIFWERCIWEIDETLNKAKPSN